MPFAVRPSPDDAQGEARGTATLHQPGDLMPVDVVGGRGRQRRRNPESLELRHAPFVDDEIVVLDGLVAGDRLGWFRRFVPPAGPMTWKLVVGVV